MSEYSVHTPLHGQIMGSPKVLDVKWTVSQDIPMSEYSVHTPLHCQILGSPKVLDVKWTVSGDIPMSEYSVHTPLHCQIMGSPKVLDVIVSTVLERILWKTQCHLSGTSHHFIT